MKIEVKKIIWLNEKEFKKLISYYKRESLQMTKLM